MKSSPSSIIRITPENEKGIKSILEESEIRWQLEISQAQGREAFDSGRDIAVCHPSTGNPLFVRVNYSIYTKLTVGRLTKIIDTIHSEPYRFMLLLTAHRSGAKSALPSK